jgi:phosphatidate phosphatase APP1
VLLGDSGQHDPAIYAEVVRAHPHRVVAVLIREVRLDPGDGRVEAVADTWDHDVPFVLAADSATLADHAARMGLITAAEAGAVAEAVEGTGLTRW